MPVSVSDVSDLPTSAQFSGLRLGFGVRGVGSLTAPCLWLPTSGPCYQQTFGVHSVLVSCVLVLRKQPKTRNMQYDAKLLACLM